MDPSTPNQLPPGSEIPFFSLPDSKDNIKKALLALIKEYQEKKIIVIGINPSDFLSFPEESPKAMESERQKSGYSFPYLYDESQMTAKTFRVMHTPDFFLFNREKKLVYHGQFDESLPGLDIPVTGRDLREALDLMLSGKIKSFQKAGTGSSIKWKLKL